MRITKPKRRGLTSLQEWAKKTCEERGRVYKLPKKRRRKPKVIKRDGVTERLPSIFDTAPVEKKKKKRLS